MRIALPLLLLAMTAPCSASEPSFTAQYATCQQANEDGSGTFERMDCMTAEIKRQGARLDAAYRTALNSTSKARQPGLRDAQRQWLKYIDADCASFFNPDNGGVPVEERAYCLMRVTSERADELEALTQANQPR